MWKIGLATLGFPSNLLTFKIFSKAIISKHQKIKYIGLLRGYMTGRINLMIMQHFDFILQDKSVQIFRIGLSV